MDSSLQCCQSLVWLWIFAVSILVLMDSSLQLMRVVIGYQEVFCFNPCFNGFFSSIRSRCTHKTSPRVSILVLMDSSLQSLHLYMQHHLQQVSILVLMDSSLQFQAGKWQYLMESCFNPCFNGFFSSISISLFIL